MEPPPPRFGLPWINSQPVDIKDILISGNAQTNGAFLARELAGVRRATTVAEAAALSQQAHRELQSLDLFDSVVFKLDKVPGRPGDMNLTVDVKEKRWWGISTEFQRNSSGENEAVVSGRIRNVLGQGEILTVSGNYNQYLPVNQYLPTSNSFGRIVEDPNFNVQLDKPRLLNTKATLRATVFQQTSFPSFQHRTKGVSVTVADEKGRHQVGLHGTWRDVMPPDLSKAYGGPSPSIIGECGSSVKTSVKYRWVDDRRDDQALPTRGTLLDVTAELAGLGGDVETAEVTGQASVFVPVLPHSTSPRAPTLELSCMGGVARPWSSVPVLSALSRYGENKPEPGVRINDRYFLGGANTLRGFSACGIGARDGQDPLGGDLFALASAKVSCALPPLLTLPARFHVWANAGNSINVNDAKPGGLGAAFETSLRASVGAGLVLGFMGQRVELNVAVPVRTSPGDRTPAWPFQLGFGIKFL